MAESFVKQVDKFRPTTGNVYQSLFKQYERVVINSLITSFGLDMFIKDQHGGDVDTVLNVRKIGSDPNMKYKNKDNEKAYNNRGAYDTGAYHNDKRFTTIKHNDREEWQETGNSIKDEYTGQTNLGFHGKTNAVPNDVKAELDHIIAAKEIHDDRGRVLSGLDGKDLANSPENLAYTNMHLNRSKSDDSVEEYIAKHPELPEETKRNMREKDKQARDAYDAKINTEYYTSRKFFTDAGKASLHTGLKMGLRQALGLVFSEIWFSVKDKIETRHSNNQSFFEALGNGFVEGMKNAKDKWGEIWRKFIEGAVAGVLSSITTTICNIFFTTAKRIVKIIRQSWASLVEAVKILLFNPDCLPFGERIRAASKVLATGASVVAGTMVSELIGTTAVGQIPVLGEIVQTFCGTLVSGVLSCSFLYFLDNSAIVNKIVEILNKIPTMESVVLYYRQQAALLEEYLAKWQDIDLAKFKREVDMYNDAVVRLENCNSIKETNSQLLSIYNQIGIDIPWGNRSFDDFMNDKNARLVFK